jgi:hypothetical protein
MKTKITKSERMMFRLSKKEKTTFEKIIKIQNKKKGEILRNYVQGYIKAYSDLLMDNSDENEKH